MLAAQQECATTVAQLEQLKQLSATSHRSPALEAELAVAKKTVTDMTMQQQLLQQEIENLHEQLDHVTTKNGLLSQKVAELHHQCTEFENQLQDLVNLRKSLVDMETRASSAELQVIETNGKLADLRAKLEASEKYEHI